MELSIDRNRLANALGRVQRVVEHSNNVEILRNVLLECHDGELRATTTDIDTTLSEKLECHTDVPGEKTVSASMLHNIVQKLPDGAEIVLKAQEDTVTITVGRSFFRLATLPKSEFPAADQFDLKGSFEIEANNLRQLIDNTLFAAANTSEVRYYLNGMFLHYHSDSETGKKSLRAVTTNSHRLARHDVSVSNAAQFLEEGVILPRKAMNELHRLLEGVEGEVLVEIGEANARFHLGKIVLSCKLIAGTYPDYQRVIPKQDGKPLQIDAQAFFGGVERISTVSQVSESKGIKFILEKKTLRLEAADNDKNQGQEELLIEHQLAPLELGFNADYLRDIGRHISGEHVQFWFPDNNGPVVLVDPASLASLFVLMPMRV